MSVDDHVEVLQDEPRVETDVVDAHDPIPAHEHALGQHAGREREEIRRQGSGVGERHTCARRARVVRIGAPFLRATIGHRGPLGR